MCGTSHTKAELDALRKQGQQDQEAVNNLYVCSSTMRVVRVLVRALAEHHHKEFPQYKGHWDGWVLLRVTEKVYSKTGFAFLPGDLTIGKVTPGLFPGEADRVVAYSLRNQVDTGFQKELAEFVR